MQISYFRGDFCKWGWLFLIRCAQARGWLFTDRGDLAWPPNSVLQCMISIYYIHSPCLLPILALFAGGWRGSWRLRRGSHLKRFRFPTVSWFCFAWQENTLCFCLQDVRREKLWILHLGLALNAYGLSFQLQQNHGARSARGLRWSRNSRPGRPSKPVQLVGYKNGSMGPQKRPSRAWIYESLRQN